MNTFNCFLNNAALDINQTRQDHLSSLGFPQHPGTVLEVGAGIGLHTKFFIDRGCAVTITDGRQENLIEIQKRWPNLSSLLLDIEHSDDIRYLGEFDMIYCYGLLYHLGDPEKALQKLSTVCRGQIFLELICNTDINESLVIGRDPQGNDQSTAGLSCRPSRLWILERLKQYFGYGYISITQPNNHEFPTNWAHPSHRNTRAVFVGSKVELQNALLSDKPLQIQQKYMKGQ